MNERAVGVADHGAAAHALVALAAHLLVVDHELLVLAQYLVLVHLELERAHEARLDLRVVAVADQPIEHALEERRQILALHHVGRYELERLARADLGRVSVEQAGGGVDALLDQLRLEIDLEQLVVDALGSHNALLVLVVVHVTVVIVIVVVCVVSIVTAGRLTSASTRLLAQRVAVGLGLLHTLQNVHVDVKRLAVLAHLAEHDGSLFGIARQVELGERVRRVVGARLTQKVDEHLLARIRRIHQPFFSRILQCFHQ